MKIPVLKTILLTAITWQSPLANAQTLISEVGAAPPEEKAKSEPKKKAAKKKEPKLAPGVLTPKNPESVKFEAKAAPAKLALNRGDAIVLLGSGMASRMNHFGFVIWVTKVIRLDFVPIPAETRTGNMPFREPKNCCQ
jgi:hypothetical protein